MALFFVSSILNAEIIFSLQDQYFENAYKQSTKVSLYEMKNVSVSMVNVFQHKEGGYYLSYFSGSGTMIVALKKIISNFNISIKGQYKSTYKGGTPSICIKSDKGKEFVVAFDENQVILNGKVFKINELYKKVLNINIEKNDKNLKITINGQVFLKKTIKDFENLNKVEFLMSNTDGYLKTSDRLYDLTISSK